MRPGGHARCLASIQCAQKVIGIEERTGERADNVFDFGGDDIALGEAFGEDFADEADGEHVLNQHFIDGGLTDVGVEGGTVTLAGKVHSLAERDAAVGAAYSAKGVSTVVDRLEVAF